MLRWTSKNKKLNAYSLKNMPNTSSFVIINLVDFELLFM